MYAYASLKWNPLGRRNSTKRLGEEQYKGKWLQWVKFWINWDRSSLIYVNGGSLSVLLLHRELRTRADIIVCADPQSLKGLTKMMLMIRPSVGDVVYITLLFSHDLIPDTQFRLARLEVKFKVNYRGTRVLAIKAPPLPKRRSVTKTLQFHVAAKNLHQKTIDTSKQQYHKSKVDMTLSMYIKIFLFLFCVIVVCFLFSLPSRCRFVAETQSICL